MVDDVALLGGSGPVCPSLAALLRQAGLAVHEQETTAPRPAAMLVSLLPCAEDAMAASRHFAAAGPRARPRLIVLIRHAAAMGDWPACREEAVLAAFTRHSALEFAASDVRVNGLTLGRGVAAGDVADAILATWRWRSMTGQTIRLDVG